MFFFRPFLCTSSSFFLVLTVIPYPPLPPLSPPVTHQIFKSPLNTWKTLDFPLNIDGERRESVTVAEVGRAGFAGLPLATLGRTGRQGYRGGVVVV